MRPFRSYAHETGPNYTQGLLEISDNIIFMGSCPQSAQSYSLMASYLGMHKHTDFMFTFFKYLLCKTDVITKSKTVSTYLPQCMLDPASMACACSSPAQLRRQGVNSSVLI